MLQRLAVVAIVFLAGCDLYWNNNADDVCEPHGALVPTQELRDPQTGQCQPFDTGGCGNGCGPCAGTGAGIQLPNWGSCFGACDALAEGACLAATGCHAAYLDNGINGGGHRFLGCWETAPVLAHTGSCASLDADGCSEHDDCISNYNTATQTVGNQKFLSCAAESQPLCLADAECGSDERCDLTTCHQQSCPDCPTCGACAPDDGCYGVCVPKDPNSCDTFDCGPGAHCQEQCTPCDKNNPTCMSQCQAMCIPDTACDLIDCGPGDCVLTCTNGTCSPTCVPHHGPGSCSGPITCASPMPACPTGSTPGIANGCYTGYCIPNADCGPLDPGTCYGPVTCITGEPSCPPGTVAGIKNGCWSGYCIPQSDCPQAPCESLATEGSCIQRNDCIPVYDGMNCTCYPDHCDCETETYARCQSAAMPL